ncbi:hypothetical protein M430DRAFT_71846, partial [Amorphotheca resinae ATCC 22711]
ETWKSQPPYKSHASFRALYSGRCHCGLVQYEISSAQPLDAKFCHCRTCQVLHGAPFQWAAIFQKPDVNFPHGTQNLKFYNSALQTETHELPCKVSCAYCRAPIMDEGRNMILLFPSLVRFAGEEERRRFGARCHMFYEQRVVDVPDGLPKWAGMSGASELIADSPPEAV